MSGIAIGDSEPEVIIHLYKLWLVFLAQQIGPTACDAICYSERCLDVVC
jgi:hypothetical protein